MSAVNAQFFHHNIVAENFYIFNITSTYYAARYHLHLAFLLIQSYFLYMNSNLTLNPALSFVGSAHEELEQREGIPLVMSSVSAGFPSPADDYIDQQLDLHRHLVQNPAATFFLRAQGESMLGAGIHDGDLLIVDRSLEASHNRVVIAAVDGELTVKRLVRRKRQVLLMPENEEYNPIDITEREHVHIWGVVSYVIHKL